MFNSHILGLIAYLLIGGEYLSMSSFLSILFLATINNLRALLDLLDFLDFLSVDRLPPTNTGIIYKLQFILYYIDMIFIFITKKIFYIYLYLYLYLYLYIIIFKDPIVALSH